MPAVKPGSNNRTRRSLPRWRSSALENGKTDVLQSVSNWLTNGDNGPWLLVLDNADDVSVLQDQSKSDNGPSVASVPRRLIDFLPRVQHGAVLTTTRDRACALSLAGHRGTPLEVQAMSLNESVRLVRNVLSTALEEEASELVEELGNVPLAVSQATAYIKAVPLVSIPQYLAIFRRSTEDQAALLNKDQGDLRRDKGVPNAVITSWELSFKQMREKFPESADLLSLMSYVDRQGIPQFLLQGDVDDVSFYEKIAPLLSFSLVRAEVGGDTFEMHRLVHRAMRHWLGSESCDQLWKERAIERVAHEFPMLENQEHYWPVCESLMSHADEVILHTASSKESELNRADILVRTAWYLVERKGNGRLAEQRSTQALEIQRQYFDDDAVTILHTLDTLAYAYYELSQYERAKNLLETILKRSRELWGPEDRQTLTEMHNLATLYESLGQFQKAEDLLKHVIGVRQGLLDPEDSQLLASMNELAQVLLDQGKYKEAEKLTTKLLEITSRCHGVEHIDTLDAMQSLSIAYVQQNKFKQAEDVIAQAIPSVTKTFGPSHRRTLDARRNLASVYYNQKQQDEAEEICKSCLDTAQEVYGPQHHTTLDIMSLLALIYRGQRRFIDALKLSTDLVKLSREVLGAGHPDTLIFVHNLALCYYDMGDKEHAIQLMTEVHDKRKDVLRADHPYIADSANRLASWKREYGETEEDGSEEREIEKEKGKKRRAWKTKLYLNNLSKSVGLRLPFRKVGS